MIYGIDLEQWDEFVERLDGEYSEEMEENIRFALKGRGAKQTAMAIMGFMPRSSRNKTHAKDVESIRMVEYNKGVPGFKVFPKANFEYLQYPSLGIGRRNMIEQAFFEKGFKSVRDILFQFVLEGIEATKAI